MSDVNLRPTNKRAKGYNNQSIQFVGEADLHFKYNNTKLLHTFLIVESNHVSLLGRDICDKLNLHVAVPDNNVNNVSNSNNCAVLAKYKDYLSPNFKSNVNHKVNLPIKPDARPIFCKARPTPLRFRESVKCEIERLESSGIITRVYQSKWACPIVTVVKPNGKLRICGDYSLTVNKSIDSVQYPLPTINEIISRIGNATVYSQIDMCQAYLQLKIDDESKEYTTINTGFGLYTYNCLPFGVSCSPFLFQAFISQVLSGVDNVIAYQDDILIASTDRESHNVLLDTVLSKLKHAGVKINVDKSSFFQSSVKYLGFVFDEKGVRPSPNKVKPILDAPAPQNIQQLQSFIGLCNFYSRFIRNFSTVMTPLYKLLRKNIKFCWGTEQQSSFDLIKGLFKTNKVLKLFNPTLPTALETDSSSYGIGSVLLQLHNNQWCPVQFASRTLNSAERNYSQIEREALSIVFGTQSFRQYLLGINFKILNDHKPLQKLLGAHSPVPLRCSSRIQRWSLRLSQFNYTLNYVKGVQNVNSDFLSRFPLPETEETHEPYELVFVVNTIEDTPISCDIVCKHTDADKNLTLLKQYIRFGFPTHVSKCLSEFKSISTELSIMKGCIMYRNRVFIPISLRNRAMSLFHAGHPGINSMKSTIRSLVWYPGIDNDVTNVVKQCNTCQENRPKPSQNSTVQWPSANRVWSRIHIDHFFFENKICLVAIDSLSKYIECEIVPSVSAFDTIQAMKLIFSRHGFPDFIVSDNATSFTAVEFKTFLKSNGIHHMTPPPYNPYSNGQAERSVRVLKDLLRKNKNGSFCARLANVLLHYRTTPHSVTGITPCVSLNNRKYVTLKDRINPLYVPSVKDKSKILPAFSVGDKVLALNLREGPKWYRSIISNVEGINTFSVYIPSLDTTWRRHSNQLLHCNSKPSTSDNHIVPNNPSALIHEPIVIPNNQLDNNNDLPLPVIPIQNNDETSINDDARNYESNIATNDPPPVNAANVPPPVDNNVPPVTVHVPLRRSARIRKPVVRYEPEL